MLSLSTSVLRHDKALSRLPWHRAQGEGGGMTFKSMLVLMAISIIADLLVIIGRRTYNHQQIISHLFAIFSAYAWINWFHMGEI
jgi:hypothetical protein